MSKRNFILLIIVLAIATIAVAGILYFSQGTTPPEEETTGTNFFSEFNPFGTNNNAGTPASSTPPVDVSGYQPDPGQGIPAAILIKISSMPIAGFGVYQKERYKDMPIVEVAPGAKPAPRPTEFATALRYVEKARGIIYQTFADKIEEGKFSGTVIPRVHEAYVGNKGQSVVMRYLKSDDKTIQTFVGALPKETLGAEPKEDNEIKGVFLPENITDMSMSPDTLKIFYLFAAGEGIVGTTMNLSDNRKVQIFDSPFTEWLSQWVNTNTITLSSKPSANIPGHMYTINPANKIFTKVLGGINGLTTLGSPDGKLILYSDSTLSLYVYHTDTRNSDVLGIRTLPEKCVWGKASNVIYCAVPKFIAAAAYPDAWYQGEVSFSDQLWKIDIKTGNTTIIADPAVSAGGEDVDGIKLALSDAEDYLFFVNKKDSFLWKLELK